MQSQLSVHVYSYVSRLYRGNLSTLLRTSLDMTSALLSWPLEPSRSLLSSQTGNISGGAGN